MRLSLSLIIITVGVTAWGAASSARAQTASAPVSARGAGHSSGRSPSRHSATRHSGDTARRSAAAGRHAATDKGGGVLALGATDITGNKELPKVMVIVPWKDSLGATGVVKPTDSLLDEALEPVDRGVFQRQVHYYGQLSAAQQRAAAGKVAPVGDSH